MFNWRKPIIYSLLTVTGNKIPAYLKEIKKIDNSSQSDQLEYQKQKLREIVLHAWKNVPYYKKVLSEARVIVNGKVNLENFDDIPVLTKDIIRKQGKNLYSKDYKQRGFYENTSGGSTGEPVKFIQDKQYDEWNIASKIYFFQKNDKEIGEPEIKFWGSDRDIIQGNLTFKDRCINFLYNRKFFNTYDLNADKFQELIQLHNNYKPKSYWAYVDAMEEFAKFINRNQIKVYSPKLIVTTIGPLYEQARNEIEKAFRCPVYNQYGSREVGWIAFEDDKHQKLDTCFWRQLIELEGQGNEKELVITTLDNYSMPLIRYKIGDVATPGVYKKIGKTKSYFTIKNVLGRTLGFFKLADGSLKHTHFIVQQLFFRNWIEQFQLIQQDYDEVLIKIVGKENKKEMREIDDLILKFLGDNFEITWKFVDKIPPTKSGKYLYTLSKVK